MRAFADGCAHGYQIQHVANLVVIDVPARAGNDLNKTADTRGEIGIPVIYRDDGVAAKSQGIGSENRMSETIDGHRVPKVSAVIQKLNTAAVRNRINRCGESYRQINDIRVGG